MGRETRIEWADHSTSPWSGCQHKTLSDGTPHLGCLNCYAEAGSKRNPHVLGEWGPDGHRAIRVDGWFDMVRSWDRAAAAAGKGRQIVFPSWCDPFEDRADLEPQRARFLDLVRTTRHLFWTLLTKRPEHAPRMLGLDEGRTWDNVAVIYSASDQRSLEDGLPRLAACKYRVAVGLSLEPLLARIDLVKALARTASTSAVDKADRRGYVGRSRENWLAWKWDLDWVIVGGESGTYARETPVDAVVDLVEQCEEIQVPCFVKQLGKVPHWRPEDVAAGLPDAFSHSKGGDWAEWPAECRVRAWPTCIGRAPLIFPGPAPEPWTGRTSAPEDGEELPVLPEPAE